MRTALTLARLASGDRPRLSSPLWLILPGLAFLAFFMILPMLQLLSLSLEDTVTGDWSLAAYRSLFESATYLRVLSTTFLMAAETAFLSLLIGYPLAYWLARLPERRRHVLILLVLLPFWTSALVKNFVWLVLLGRTGIAMQILRGLGIPEPTELLFGHGAVLFAMVHTMLPLAVLTMLPTMLQVDARLPLAAATLGASRAHRFWRIYFPLSMPGVATAGLLVLIASLGFFVAPALLGSPRETLIAQIIITQILALQNWSFAGALTTMLVAAALVMCLAYDWIFGLTTVSGARVVAHRMSPLPRRLANALLKSISAGVATLEVLFEHNRPERHVASLGSVFGAIVIAFLLLPVVALVPMAFTTSSFLSFPPPVASMKWFAAYLGSPVWLAATLRSFGIGSACACLTFLMAFPAAYGVARAGGHFAKAAFLIFLTPMIIPHIAISLSLFYLFSQISLVATDMGIAIGHAVLAMPTVFLISLATMKSYDWKLSDAAATLGAGRLRTILRVNLPLMRNGLIAALIFGFLLSFEELTVAMFVGGGLKTTLPKQMWDNILLQLDPTLAAASVAILVIVAALFLLTEYLRSGEARP